MSEMKIIAGVLPPKIDIRDYKLKRRTVMAANYPETFELDKRVKVKDQGFVGSCVAHASAEILEYHANDSKK